MATAQNTALPLASLARDPVVRAFFERSRRDGDAAYAIPAANPPSLSGGAAKALKRELVAA